MTTRPTGALRILMVSAQLAPFVRGQGRRGGGCAHDDDRNGGAGRAVSCLARELAILGHDVRVVAPRHASVDLAAIDAAVEVPPFAVPMNHRGEMATVYRAALPGDVTVYLVDDPRYFGPGAPYLPVDDAERYVFLSRAALELVRRPEIDWRPDIVHCHDWQTGLVPNWLRTTYRSDPILAQAASVFTVHDLQHQGILGYHVLELAGLRDYGFFTHPDIPELSELVNLLARGVINADLVTTVSETYAREVQTPEHGERLDPLFRDLGERLVGILNGADTEAYNPSEDALIASPFSSEALADRAPNKAALQGALGLATGAQTPLIGLVSRLDEARGWDVLSEALEPMVANLGSQVVVLGAGEQMFEERVSALAHRYPDRVCRIAVPEPRLERLLYAGCDIYLAPARIEPNGSNHLLAMHYGAVPVVHATGGLADAVSDYDAAGEAANGFRYETYDAWALFAAVVRAVEVYRHPMLWQPLQRRCMAYDLSWRTAAEKYVTAYHRARTNRRPREMGR